MTGSETGHPFYPDLQLSYTQGTSVYGELSPGITEVLGKIKRRKIVDATIGDGRIVPILLARGNVIIAGDLNQTVDEDGKRPLDVLAARFPEAVGSTLFLREMNAFGRLPLGDDSADIATDTGFMYLFPVELIQRHVQELSRVAGEGIIFDFATNIERRRIADKTLVPRRDSVDYTTEEGLAVVRYVLKNDYEPPLIGIEQVEQELPQAGYRMTNIKLNVHAIKRR
ncbi:MAG: hypothetical protein ACREHC_05490 [Candidatus Levyibacteriota bacterium]